MVVPTCTVLYSSPIHRSHVGWNNLHNLTLSRQVSKLSTANLALFVLLNVWSLKITVLLHSEICYKNVFAIYLKVILLRVTFIYRWDEHLKKCDSMYLQNLYYTTLLLNSECFLIKVLVNTKNHLNILLLRHNRIVPKAHFFD